MNRSEELRYIIETHNSTLCEDCKLCKRELRGREDMVKEVREWLMTLDMDFGSISDMLHDFDERFK